MFDNDEWIDELLANFAGETKFPEVIKDYSRYPEAKATISAKLLEARLKTLRSLPDVRLGGDSAQWFEDYLWQEIKKLEDELQPPTIKKGK